MRVRGNRGVAVAAPSASYVCPLPVRLRLRTGEVRLAGLGLVLAVVQLVWRTAHDQLVVVLLLPGVLATRRPLFEHQYNVQKISVTCHVFMHSFLRSRTELVQFLSLILASCLSSTTLDRKSSRRIISIFGPV